MSEFSVYKISTLKFATEGHGMAGASLNKFDFAWDGTS